MSTTNFQGYIDTLRKLAGEPSVTYPYGDTAYPVVTRLVKDVRTRAVLDALKPDKDAARFPGCVLVSQQEVGGDLINCEMLRRYERIPSPWITDYSIEPETRLPIRSQHRKAYAPDYVSLSVTDAVTNGTTTITSATGGFTAAMVGSVVYLSGPTTEKFVQVVSRTSANAIVVNTTVAAGTGITLRIGGALKQVPYYEHSTTGIDIHLCTESLLLFNGGSAPAYRVERGWTDYTFPNLLFSITGTVAEARDGTADLLLNYNERSAFSKNVPRRTVITYGIIGSLSPADVFSPNLNDLKYNGRAFSVNAQNVLNDDFEISYTSGTQNPKWPYFVEVFNANQSDTSATEYNDLINASGTPSSPDEQAPGELCIGSPINPWRFGLERKEVSYVKAL